MCTKFVTILNHSVSVFDIIAVQFWVMELKACQLAYTVVPYILPAFLYLHLIGQNVPHATILLPAHVVV